MLRPVIATAVVLSLALPAAGQSPDPRSRRVDSVFAQVSSVHAPGCAVGVVERGQLVHRRGYGMADLERRVPITPGTVFYTGSVSKQFTAMAVALLARDGKISLDDPARRYLPELPEAGREITIRQMVHHTSGLREKWDLLQLGGFRPGNLVTQDDVLDLVKRQRELNFAPGDDHLYNNTAYDLLATLVHRVTGQSIRKFAEQRIFGPLGMAQSQFSDHRTELIADRALGYSVRADGIRHDPAWVETVGSGSVYSTIEDLARWAESFTSGALGGPELVRLVETPGRLNDGTELSYAFGLMVDRWRGQRRVQHGGALAGFRAQLTRFPDARLAVIVLCNFAQANPDAYASRVAEIYLGDRLAAAPGRTDPPRTFGDPDLARRAAGVYRSDRTGTVARLVTQGDSLLFELPFGRRPLRANGPDRAVLWMPGGEQAVQLEGAAHGPVSRLSVSGLGPRPEVFSRVDPPATDRATLAQLAGTYRSSELGVTWTVAARDSGLVATSSVGSELALRPTARDAFSAQGWNVTVERDARGRVTGLRITPGRSRHLRFERVATAGR